MDWIVKAQHAEQAGAVGVVFVNSEESLDPLPIAAPGQYSQLPCVMIPKGALNNKLLTCKSFGRGRMPTHSNPDGPSFCKITAATMGLSGMVDFRALIDGLEGKFIDHDFPPTADSLYVDPAQPMPAFSDRKIVWKR